MQQIPTLIAQFGGKKAVDGLLSTLTEEQKALLFEMLTAEQKTILANIMRQRSNNTVKKESSNAESKS